MDIQSSHSWYTGTSSLASTKAPTCLLLKSDESFDSFGYEAEDKFADIVADNLQGDYFYFTRFKMDLYRKKMVTRGMEIQDINDKVLPALRVFSLSIEYLKTHLLRTLKDRLLTITMSDVKFILTVPAISTDAAKQFMREAAIEAGIDSGQLFLALEPEAASLYCRTFPMEMINEDGLSIAYKGSQYVIADIGGGTADFSVHEIESKTTIMELHKATGGEYGGELVNEEFVQMFQTVFGVDALHQLKREDLEDYKTLLREFETKKRTVKLQSTGSYNVRIPASLAEISKSRGRNLKEAINSSEYERFVSIARDKLKIDALQMQGFFDKSIRGIVHHIKEILNKFPNIRIIIVVGGFGECILLQEKLKTFFQKKSIIIPEHCSLAVLKGAVLYGHFPLSISSRLMRYTYGVHANLNFVHGLHPETHKFLDEDSKEKCRGAFVKIISSGSRVLATGTTVKLKGHPLSKHDTSVTTKIYYTEKENPVVVDDSCVFLKAITLPFPKHVHEKRICEEVYTFGLTELKYKATILDTKEVITDSIDLLD
ncbi:heat shock 70 kDa protein 12A-like [Ostrea edulis]|uniref:heat shock 70 kDa protein 12A-like n=1 Tax=Ostrea edulis TaxID=37623 RepID=UPI0024AFE9DD|nr:heat shock 70 kDa protein 12A-like [Ostrea edulis]